MTTYLLKSEKIDGHIELSFDDGRLIGFKMLIKQALNSIQYRALMDSIGQYESELYQLEKLNLTVEMEAPVNQKLALFCRFYEQAKGVKYKVSPRCAGMIKQVTINEEILTVYFASKIMLFADKHSVGNLVKYYNPLLAEVAAKSKPKSTHPDHWSPQYAAKLTDAQIGSYYAHLHSLGYKPQRDNFGNVKDFYKEVK